MILYQVIPVTILLFYFYRALEADGIFPVIILSILDTALCGKTKSLFMHLNSDLQEKFKTFGDG